MLIFFCILLESLTDRKEKLKMADALRRALAVAGQLRRGNIRVAVQYLRRRSREAKVRRGIDAVSKVHADRSHWRAIANPKTYRLDHIVEILGIILVETKRQIAQAGIDVSHVVEQNALDILSDEGEAQLDVIDEESVATQRKSGRRRRRAAWNQRRADVAGAGLIERVCAQRIRAPGVETLRQRDRFLSVDARRRVERHDQSELSLPREHQIFPQ